jgi:hypothetical protein
MDPKLLARAKLLNMMRVLYGQGGFPVALTRNDVLRSIGQNKCHVPYYERWSVSVVNQTEWIPRDIRDDELVYLIDDHDNVVDVVYNHTSKHITD